MALTAFAFSGGYAMRKQLENLQLPQFGLGSLGDSLCFKLSVRIVSASVPALGQPGGWSRQRPRLEVHLRDTQKETEFADYAGDDNTGGLDNCPWRFGETLTFVCRQADVLSPGLHINLRAHSDFQLGPVQFQFASTTDLGEASLDIRRRALPACIGHQHSKHGSWESPILVIPLSHVKDGRCSADHCIGEAVAHVTLAFSVDTDPEAILAALDMETRGVADVLGASDVINWMENPWEAAWLNPGAEAGHELVRRVRGPARHTPPLADGNCNPDNFNTYHKQDLMGDLAPDGWISYVAPNGRKFWHHKTLGPAPWECKAGSHSSKSAAPPAPVHCGHASPSKTKKGQHKRGSPNGQRRTWSREAILTIVNGPDQEPTDWVSHQGPDGRIFWHHVALGPAPWDLKPELTESLPDECEVGVPPSTLRAAWVG
jgi:hypothetical protein